jgi:hypothetical protein
MRRSASGLPNSRMPANVGLRLAIDAAHRAERLEQIVVAVAELLGAGVQAAAQRGGIRPARRGRNRRRRASARMLMVRPLLRAGVAAQHPQILVGAALVGRADAAEGSARQAGGLDIDRLVPDYPPRHDIRPRPGVLPVDTLDAAFPDAHGKLSMCSRIARPDRCCSLSGSGTPSGRVNGVALVVDRPVDPEQQVAAVR